jgi:fatty-acyl-CoA synthase
VLLAGIAVLEYSIFFPAQTGLEAILRCIQAERITRMNGVPSLYLAMAERAGDYDLSSLRAGLIAGGPVTEAQFLHIEETLHMTLISVYGMSECIGITCSSWRDPQAVRAAGVGPAYPMNTLRLVDADGNPVPQGREGEICVRSPMRMLGYYGKPLDPEEFFPTGDLGWLDETGVLHLSGRKKDIIIRNGNNLSPRRIEDALLGLPGVKAAAVVGLPHPLQGEVPCAMIVGRAEPADLAPLLHKNELPEAILSVEALPLTASGKPDKPQIREVLRTWRNL